LLSAFSGLVNLLTTIIRWFEGARLRREAQAEVIAAIQKDEAKANEIAAKEYLDRPTRDELSKRMHSGEF
jgi:hypothetical protein